MTAPQPIPTQPSAWHMYRALVGVGLGCGLAIVAVFEVTRPIIRENRIAARRAAILDVLPGAATSRVFRLGEDGGFRPTSEDSEGNDLVFAGYDGAGALAGLALQAEGMGYQDVVRMLYGYSFEAEAVIGFRVLESRETPGLGDRVETEPAFLANFERLDVRLTPAGDALAHPVEFVKPGQKESPWQIDGITGATITSRAIANMLRASTAYWIPKVVARRPDFEQKE